MRRIIDMTEQTVIGIGCLLFSLLGILYCPHWIRNASGGRDKGTGIFCMIMSFVALLIAVILLVF